MFQCCFFRQTIVLVSPKSILFHYQNKNFWIKVSKKTFSVFLKIEALLDSLADSLWRQTSRVTHMEGISQVCYSEAERERLEKRGSSSRSRFYPLIRGRLRFTNMRQHVSLHNQRSIPDLNKKNITWRKTRAFCRHMHNPDINAHADCVAIALGCSRTLVWTSGLIRIRSLDFHQESVTEQISTLQHPQTSGLTHENQSKRSNSMSSSSSSSTTGAAAAAGAAPAAGAAAAATNAPGFFSISLTCNSGHN